MRLLLHCQNNESFRIKWCLYRVLQKYLPHNAKTKRGICERYFCYTLCVCVWYYIIFFFLDYWPLNYKFLFVNNIFIWGGAEKLFFFTPSLPYHQKKTNVWSYFWKWFGLRTFQHLHVIWIIYPEIFFHYLFRYFWYN